MRDPLKPLRVVLVHGVARDKALADDMDFDAYVETRDPALVKAKEGMAPTWFELTPLKSEWVADYVETQPTHNARFKQAFLGACHRLDGPDGEKLARTHQTGGGQRVADVGWLKGVAARYGLAAITELGSLAWQLTQVPEGYEGPFF